MGHFGCAGWHTQSENAFNSWSLGNRVTVARWRENLNRLARTVVPANVIFLDEHSHYSVVDACDFFDLPVNYFAHRDAQALREALRDHVRPGQVPLVMSDGVFTSRGSIAPVKDYLEVLQQYDGAMLCLDDCHAFGVLGERGRGTYEYHGIVQQGINDLPDRDSTSSMPRLFVAGTLSKAFGGYGGIVSGTASFIESVKSSSHYYRGASAPPIPVAAASAAALKLVAKTPERVAQVQHNARQLKKGLRTLGLDVDDSPVPIVGLTLGDAQNMQRIKQGLANEGILIAHSEKYSGLGKSGALRIAVFATHTDEMIRKLTEGIGRHL